MDLSILIPARNEQFLARTVQDALAHIQGDTEIIVVLDGAPSDPPLPQDDRLRVIEHATSIGQRAATNEAARVARGKYLMKVDAHCAFDDGFDVKLLADANERWTMVPLMRNLHVFDWVCANGHRRYQSRSGPCTNISAWLLDRMQTQGYSTESLAVRIEANPKTITAWLEGKGIPSEVEKGRLYDLFGEIWPCGLPTTQEIVWIPKRSPSSTAYCFDPSPHFQYFNGFKKRREGQGPLSESMSLQGSCWMLSAERYWTLNICDETFGSWGSQGIEVACKTWLSGGKVMCNHKTWYAHTFRTQGGDWGFPYPQSESRVGFAQQRARELFFERQWEQAIYPLSWLVERFWPIDEFWTLEDLRQLKGLCTTPA